MSLEMTPKNLVPVTAIRKLLDYVMYDERKHYETEPTHNHIYLSVKAVEEWVASLTTSDEIGMNEVPFAPR